MVQFCSGEYRMVNILRNVALRFLEFFREGGEYK